MIFKKCYLLFQIKEYELSEVFHHEEDKDHFEVMRGEPITHNEIPGTAHNSDIEEQIEVERREEEMRRFTRASTLDPNAIVPTTPLPVFTTSSPLLPTGKTAVLNSIVQIYNHDAPGKQLRATKLRRTMRKFRKFYSSLYSHHLLRKSPLAFVAFHKTD